MRRDDLVTWLDDFLKIHEYPDLSLNGLQVEGKDDVERIGVAVDAAQATSPPTSPSTPIPRWATTRCLPASWV